MSIFTIGDLHLSFGTDKPMDIFGWGNHTEKIKIDWLEKVNEDDTVIIPGDFSWAMQLEEAYKDFEFINNLPGKKIISKGNHDYWWNTITKMEKYLKENNFETINFMQNNSYLVENKIIVGTRGWLTNNWNTDTNYKILKRENDRLKLGIKNGIQNFKTDKEIIVFLHYPPFYKENVPDEINFIKTMKEFNVHRCFYGHLHGEAHKDAFVGEINGINFELVSCDYLDFKLKKVTMHG